MHLLKRVIIIWGLSTNIHERKSATMHVSPHLETRLCWISLYMYEHCITCWWLIYLNCCWENGWVNTRQSFSIAYTPCKWELNRRFVQMHFSCRFKHSLCMIEWEKRLFTRDLLGKMVVMKTSRNCYVILNLLAHEKGKYKLYEKGYLWIC